MSKNSCAISLFLRVQGVLYELPQYILTGMQLETLVTFIVVVNVNVAVFQ